MKANGTYVRQAALEAPEQIGRGERHGGIMTDLMKSLIKEHHVIGKDQMKQVGYVAQEVTHWVREVYLYMVDTKGSVPFGMSAISPIPCGICTKGSVPLSISAQTRPAHTLMK